MNEDATTPTLVETPSTAVHEFDNVKQTAGPRGWTKIEFWSQSPEAVTVADTLRALADKLEA